MKTCTALASSLIALVLMGCGGGTSVGTSITDEQRYDAENHVWDYLAFGPFVEWVCVHRRTTAQAPISKCSGVAKTDAYPENNVIPNASYPPLSEVYKGMPIEILCAAPMKKLREQYPTDYVVEYSTSSVAETLYNFNFSMGLDYYRRYYLDSEFVRENGTNRIAVIWSRPPVMVPTRYTITSNGVSEDRVFYTEKTDRIIWTIQRRSFPREWLDCSSWGTITSVSGEVVSVVNWNWSYR